ncbi:MAG: D-aminoacylase [Candidatus Rokubacteria bacterium]|nr:D-aminoacylase [Candidatus Rokubacteria bacterium]
MRTRGSSPPPAGARTCSASPPRRPSSVLDLKIEGAEVIDGTGTAGGRTDVGVRDGLIAAVGDLSGEAAGNRLHAAGRVLAPGFIDMHSHSDWRLWGHRRAESKIRQGVTTEVVGNCGFSPAPAAAEHLDDLRGFALYVPKGMDFAWRSVGAYLDAFDRDGSALNVVQLVGHGTLRIAAMGFARRAPDARELALMQSLFADAMDAGAWGLSSGLIYAPGSYATTEELVALARVAGRQRGLYASHIRGEGATLLDAVAEAIRIGREGRVSVQVSHLKAAGRPNWGTVADALALIDAARAEGLDVMADVYPYTASSTTLRTLLPDWALEGGVDAMLARLADPAARARIRAELEAPPTGQSLLDRVGWENVMVSSCAARKDAEGRRLSELGAARGVAPLDAALDLLADEGGKAYMILFQLAEADVRRVLAHPAVMIGSDGSALAPYGELAAGKPHPRSYGTFPRVLGEYAREQRVLSLPQAVHKMTGLPARRLGLADRGVIAPGKRADLVVFDAKRVADQATYEEPHRYPAGVEHVLVNGRFVIKDGEHTGSLPGRVLRPA